MSDMAENRKRDMPSVEQLEKELERTRYTKSFARVLRNTIFTLITVAAIAVLVAVLFLPVLKIYGTSMHPTLVEGDIVISVKNSDMKQGDVIAFYYNNKILVKRVVAFAGDWVDIAEDGTVYVNNQVIDEPYISKKNFGLDTNIELPYQVPESRVFVLGDHRDTSTDSRSKTIGCIAEEQIVGKLVFRIWPFSAMGPVR